MTIDEEKSLTEDEILKAEARPWDEGLFDEPVPPPDWNPAAVPFDDESLPPQIVRTVNQLPIPQHDIAKDDVAKIANFILSRAREGIGDIFAHGDYYQTEGLVKESSLEAFARAIAEHQTGIPYTQPAYFYPGGQKAVARAIGAEGVYPLAGQCQQSATTALCFGGWDGGGYGDVGSDINAQIRAAKLGKGWTPKALAEKCKPGKTGLVLADWPDDLWREVTVGTCIFWSAPCPMTKDGKTCGPEGHVVGCGQGSGHVAVVIRKHPTERKWQLWDTTTSFSDPAAHPAAQKGARMLWESHWWGYIPAALQQGNWPFRGLGSITGIADQLRGPLLPRGRCRLILRRRKDGALLHRSDWISMQEWALPISWLLRSMRGAPHFEEIEPTWCIDSPGYSGKPAIPLLDCTCDTKGNAKMSWVPAQGSHKRPMAASIWSAAGVYPAQESAAAAAPATPASATTPSAATPAPATAGGTLKNPPLAGQKDLEAIVAGRASALRRGARGDGVKALQEALIALKFTVSGGADGVFGGGAEAAVKAFQSSKGLDCDGVVGRGTLAALDAALC
jgi:hypothetical protein